MKLKTYLTTVTLILLAGTIVHFIRIIYGMPVTIGHIMIPLWVSWFEFAVGCFIVYQGWKLRR